MKRHRSQYVLRYRLTGLLSNHIERMRDFEKYEKDWIAKLSGKNHFWKEVAATALAGLDIEAYWNYKDRGSNYQDNVPKASPLVHLNFMGELTLHDRAIIFEIATILWARGEEDVKKYISNYEFNSLDQNNGKIEQEILHLVYGSTIEEFWEKKREDKKSIQEKFNQGSKLVKKELLKAWLKYEGKGVIP